MAKKDKVFFNPKKEIGPFRFDEQVTDVFPDMLRRSIPGYATSLNMIEMFAHRLGTSGSRMYDLGSSLGAATQAMHKGNHGKNISIVAVDNSLAMIRRSRELVQPDPALVPVQFICADMCDVKIKNASLVILNYTLQFLDPEQRTGLIQHIYNGLQPGGGLLLSEKIAFQDSDEQDFQADWYYAFKEYNGYSQLEISQKRTALENVLIPDTWETHQNRLHKVGFQTIHLWHRFFSFASIIALK